MEIYTEVTNKEIEDALLGDINRMWEVISSLDGDKDFLKKLERVKNGIEVGFDIRSITMGEYERKIAFDEVRIRRKQRVNIIKFDDEIDARKKIMKEILRSLYDDDFDKQAEEEIDGYTE